MAKHIQVRDVSNNRKDRYILEVMRAGVGTEVTLATSTDAKAGTSEEALVTAKGLADVVGAPMGATFTIGAEGTNTKLVSVQLTDAAGADMAVSAGVMAYLSDDADGSSIVATAPDGGWAITTDGLLIPLIAGKAAYLVSEADGDIAVTLTEAGTKTCYLVLVLPTGKLAISGAITHAA